MSTTEHHDAKVTIHIDAKPYKLAPGPTTISTLRALRKPPVPEHQHVWLDIDDAQDVQLEDTASIDIVEGMRFFSEVDAVTIRIDRTDYEVYKRKMSGAELRTVPSPDVAADRDLWLDVPDKRDVKVQDEDVIRLKDGTRFFTAPGRINPGSVA